MLKGTVALVTGGASGLGRASVNRIVSSGGKAVICDLESQGERAMEIVKSHGKDSVLFEPCDVTSASNVTSALDAAENAGFGVVNAAVSCAGVATAAKILGKRGPHDLEAFENVLRINAVGTFNVNR